ncbi:hypothetical protein [Chitinophaga skermanii]|nr:hypothetical protein [Chitinophaga skermanii]
MKRFPILLLLCIVATQVKAQTIDTVVQLKNEQMERFYFTLMPKTPSKGLIVILSGYGSPQETLKDTRIAQTACEAGYTVVLPWLTRTDTPNSEEIFTPLLEKSIPEWIEKYKVPKNKFIIGGHSWAGHQAVKYTENANKPGYKTIVKPNAVFAVDPPMDLSRLYRGYFRMQEVIPNAPLTREGLMISEMFKARFGGTPAEQKGAYAAASSYTRDLSLGGDAQYLKNVPVRLYGDPDVDWFIRERQTPVEWTNMADVTACIVLLQALGNKNAEYVNCLGKGIMNGNRHPHGFAMVDPKEFVQWVDKVLHD